MRGKRGDAHGARRAVQPQVLSYPRQCSVSVLTLTRTGASGSYLWGPVTTTTTTSRARRIADRRRTQKQRGTTRSDGEGRRPNVEGSESEGKARRRGLYRVRPPSALRAARRTALVLHPHPHNKNLFFKLPDRRSLHARLINASAPVRHCECDCATRHRDEPSERSRQGSPSLEAGASPDRATLVRFSRLGLPI